MKLNKVLLMSCIAGMSFVIGCNCNKQKAEKTIGVNRLSAEDSLQIVHSFNDNDGLKILNSHSQQWIMEKLHSADIDWQSFDLKSVSEVDSSKTLQNIVNADSFYVHYDSVLSWSNDSSFIIDFGSYGNMALKGVDGKVHLEGSDPDTKVSIINVKDKTQTQILYAGPSTHIMGAKWLNSAEALLLFSQTNNSNNQDTLLWLVDVTNNQIRQYKYH